MDTDQLLESLFYSRPQKAPQQNARLDQVLFRALPSTDSL